MPTIRLGRLGRPILTELARTLTNPYFSQRFSPTELTATVARVAAEARLQALTVHVAGVATHPEDDAILATALSAHARYLVTGDRHLQERGVYGGTHLRHCSRIRQAKRNTTIGRAPELAAGLAHDVRGEPECPPDACHSLLASPSSISRRPT